MKTINAHRFILLLFILLVSRGVLYANTIAPTDIWTKESIKLVKKLQKEGWSVYGSEMSLKECVDIYYKKLAENEGKLIPITKHAKAKRINLAINICRTNAIKDFAGMIGSSVEGETTTKILNKSGGNAESHTDFTTKSHSAVDQNLEMITPSVILYRAVEGGYVEVCIFFLVSVAEP